MRKTYMMLVTLALFLLGMTNANAGERISLEEVPFCTWEGWDANAQATGTADCAWVIGEATGQPYGDASVNNFADLSLYSKLIVVVAEGTPRFLFNRDKADGQWNATESESHLIDNTSGGWSAKYFSSETTDEGTVYTVDLKLMAKEKGFAHLHAIKCPWGTQITVLSMEVERQGKVAQVGWTQLITNGDLEGEDNSCFYSKENGGEPFPSIITDGVGVNGSRGIMVHSAAGAAQDWDAQFWINLPETLAPGTKYRVKFDYMASADATADTQAHRDPSDYIHWAMIGSPNFTTVWQTYNQEGELTEEQSGGSTMHSIAFNLSKDKSQDIDFFFDNISFEVYKYGTSAEFSNDVIQLDFGFETNIADLVKESGKKRLLYPLDCAKVTVNGEAVALYSVEGFEDGRFYIFLNDAAEDEDEVIVSFTNPADKKYHLVYTTGPKGDVNDIQGLIATCNEDIEDNDGYPYDYLTPVVMSADPEDGSFNLPNSIKTFKLNFDKNVDCAALSATINGKKLTVSPADGFAEEITLIRESSTDLTTGAYTIKVNHIYPEMRLADEVFGEYSYTFNVGKVDADPNDVEETVMTDDFANGGDGWIVNSGGTMQPANSGSGCRIIGGQSGFTSTILYLGSRADNISGIALYGADSKKMTLKAKNYHLTLGAAMWDGNQASRTLKVQVVADGAVDTTNGDLLDESKVIAEEMQAIIPDFKTSTDATLFDIVVPVQVEGDYVIRLVSGNSSGNPVPWADANAIGNVKVEYRPNTVGAEWVRLLREALTKAKEIRDNNAADRYAGAAYDALTAAIAKYEAEMENYTAPTVYQKAAADLETLGKDMTSHHSLCDDYDKQVKTICDVVRQNAENKFNKTDLYAQVVALAAKYEATSEWQNVNEDPEDEPVYELVYTFNELKDDAALTAAIAEMKEIATTTSLLFTTGESKVATTGVAALTERFRLGAETLLKLGVEESDPLYVEVNNALNDNDGLADRLKKRITGLIYSKLQNGSNTLFQTVITDNGDEETPVYDMTAFVKNPNIYALHYSDGVSEQNVPGWTVEGAAGLFVSWSGAQDVAGIAEDCSFTIWHNNSTMEQTITDLPAGVYNITIDAARWDDPYEVDDNGDLKRPDIPEPASYAYYKTSATPEEEYAGSEVLAYYGQYVMNHDNLFEGVEITDGILTLGSKFVNDDGQYFFDKVRLQLVAAAVGFDYAAAYQEHLTGIDATVTQPAKVLGFELYDLNGRRIATVQKGITIVKKYMSDGTIVTEKVIKK